MALGAGGGGQAAAVRAGEAYVEVTARNEQLRKGLDQAKGRINQFAESAKKAFSAFGGSGVLGDLLGGVGGLGGLAGVASVLGPQGALLAGAATLATVVGKAAIGFDRLSDAQERGKKLSEELAATYDKLIAKILTAAEASNDLKTATDAQTGAVNDYRSAEARANQLRAQRDALEQELGDAGFLNPTPAQKSAGDALQQLLPKLAEAEANLATQKGRRAAADETVSKIQSKLLDEQNKMLDGLRKEIDLRTKSNDERLREAFLKLGPSGDRLAEFDRLAQEAAAQKEFLELTRKESEKGAAAEKARLAAIEAITKALREQAATAGLSPADRVRRELEQLGADKEVIDQGVKDAAELERLRNLPEATRRAFREMFGGGAAKALPGLGTSAGAFSGPFKQILGGSDVGKAQLTEAQKQTKELTEINKKLGRATFL